MITSVFQAIPYQSPEELSMARPPRRLCTALAAASFVALGLMPLLAQEPKGPTAPDSVARGNGNGNGRRVPPYFGQLGLTPEQKEKIYKIQGDSQAKVDALQRQIDEVKAKALTDSEAVLTPEQKKLLEHRRDAARSAKPAPSRTTPAPGPEKKAS
jgi:Spy/CpxP family protein refolding chaperone